MPTDPITDDERMAMLREVEDPCDPYSREADEALYEPLTARRWLPILDAAVRYRRELSELRERLTAATICDVHGPYDAGATGNCPRCPTCTRCGGDGEVDGVTSEDAPVTCPKCRGTGRSPVALVVPSVAIAEAVQKGANLQRELDGIAHAALLQERDAATARAEAAEAKLLRLTGSPSPRRSRARKKGEGMRDWEREPVSEEERLAMLNELFGGHHTVLSDFWRGGAVIALDAAVRYKTERDSVRSAAIAVLVDSGPCDWSESDPPGLCDRADCSYCALDRMLSTATATKGRDDHE